jgi:hypothetical protein
MLCYILPINDSGSQDGAGWAEEEELERPRRRQFVPARRPSPWCLPVDGVFWYTKHVHYTLVWI